MHTNENEGSHPDGKLTNAASTKSHKFLESKILGRNDQSNGGYWRFVGKA